MYDLPAPRRTPLIRVLGPLFWNAPFVHLRGLEKIWIDGIITFIPWSSFIGKLQGEWQEFVLYVRTSFFLPRPQPLNVDSCLLQATVLLNANVALLAIPTVVDGDGNVTSAQIASYLSVVASIGCILVGLLLIRQHRVKSKDTAEEAVRVLPAQSTSCELTRFTEHLSRFAQTPDAGA